MRWWGGGEWGTVLRTMMGNAQKIKFKTKTKKENNETVSFNQLYRSYRFFLLMDDKKKRTMMDEEIAMVISMTFSSRQQNSNLPP